MLSFDIRGQLIDMEQLERLSDSLLLLITESYSIGKLTSLFKVHRCDWKLTPVSSFSQDMELIDMDLPSGMINYLSCEYS